MNFVHIVRHGRHMNLPVDEIRAGDLAYYNGQPYTVIDPSDDCNCVQLQRDEHIITCKPDELDCNKPDDYKPGLYFDQAITTQFPTWALIDDIQALRRGLAEDDWSFISSTIECMEDTLEKHTFQPAENSLELSGSSVVLGGVKPGIVHLADGQDLPCKAGQPVGSILSGGCRQCDCPRYDECFDEELDDPFDGIIQPYGCDMLRPDDDQYMKQLVETYGEDIEKTPIKMFTITCLRHHCDSSRSLFVCLRLFDRYILQVRVFTDGFYQIYGRVQNDPNRPSIMLDIREDPKTGLPVKVCVEKVNVDGIDCIDDLDRLRYEYLKAEEACRLIQTCLIDHWEETWKYLFEHDEIS